jgi:putative transposase
MLKWRQWEAASEAEWGLAVERESVIRPLAEQQRLSGDDVGDAMRRLHISRTVVYELIHRYRQRPQTSSLLPWKRGRNNNAIVLDQKRERLLNSCIKESIFAPRGRRSRRLFRRSNGNLRNSNYRLRITGQSSNV